MAIKIVYYGLSLNICEVTWRELLVQHARSVDRLHTVIKEYIYRIKLSLFRVIMIQYII